MPEVDEYDMTRYVQIVILMSQLGHIFQNTKIYLNKLVSIYLRYVQRTALEFAEKCSYRLITMFYLTKNRKPNKKLKKKIIQLKLTSYLSRTSTNPFSLILFVFRDILNYLNKQLF